LLLHCVGEITPAKMSQEFRGFPRFFAHKEKPGKPGVSWLYRKARTFLALQESQECLGFPHFPVNPGMISAFLAFQDSVLSWETRNSTPQKPGKARKVRKNSPRFPGFPLCAKKKRGKPGMIPCFPGFSGFCCFLESPEFYTPKARKSQEIQEEMVHAFLAFPYVQKSAESQE